MVVVIPYHGFLFSLIGYRLPFNEFEVSVLNHLLIAYLTVPSRELGIRQSFPALERI